MSTTTANASDIYRSRAESGLYDDTVDQVVELPRGTALATSTYDEDFHRVVAARSSNFIYRSRSTEVEHEGILIGQLCKGTLGSRFNAKGNFYPGTPSEPAYIDDKSRIKFLFTLCKPTESTHRMEAMWDNQIATLTEVLDADKTELERAKKNLPFKDWTAHAGSDTSLPPDLINVMSEQIYVVPKVATVSNGSPAKKTKIVKKSIAKEEVLAKEEVVPNDDATEGSNEDGEMHVEEVLANTSISDDAGGSSALPELPAATINDLHPPTALSDYGGPLFRHERAMLKQLDMRDEDNVLVPPSAWYSKFTPGSLLMIRYTMHAFNWPNRRVYQLNAHSIRLLDGSKEPIDERIASDPGENSPTNDTSSTTAASTAMETFSLGKRSRK